MTTCCNGALGAATLCQRGRVNKWYRSLEETHLIIVMITLYYMEMMKYIVCLNSKSLVCPFFHYYFFNISWALKMRYEIYVLEQIYWNLKFYGIRKNKNNCIILIMTHMTERNILWHLSTAVHDICWIIKCRGNYEYFFN